MSQRRWHPRRGEVVLVRFPFWVKLSNLATVPKAAIARRLGDLPPTGLQEVDDRLRQALDLD